MTGGYHPVGMASFAAKDPCGIAEVCKCPSAHLNIAQLWGYDLQRILENWKWCSDVQSQKAGQWPTPEQYSDQRLLHHQRARQASATWPAVYATRWSKGIQGSSWPQPSTAGLLSYAKPYDTTPISITSTLFFLSMPSPNFTVYNIRLSSIVILFHRWLLIILPRISTADIGKSRRIMMLEHIKAQSIKLYIDMQWWYRIDNQFTFIKSARWCMSKFSLHH